MPDPAQPAGHVTLPQAALDALGIEGPVFATQGGVTRLETDAGIAWAKTLEPPRRGLNSMILPTISLLIPLPILRSTGIGKGGDTLLKQANRLRELTAGGLPVAPLLYGDHDVMITGDGGRTVEKLVRHPDRLAKSDMDQATLRDALLAMTTALAALHTHGTAHGRPKIRDFAWRDGQVTILDLEERPWEVMPMADAQARDVFLWVHDLCSAAFSREIAPEAAVILSQEMTDKTRHKLHRFLRLLRLTALPARRMLRLLPGNRELTAGLAAYDVLREIVR